MYYLIGKDLSYSISKDIHKIVNSNYEHLEFENEKSTLEFLAKKNFKGLNVTIPYKELIAKNVDELIGSAKEINIVNTVLNKENKLYGYNTDINGVIKSLNSLDLNYEETTFLILGTGATSKTVEYSLKKLNAKKIFFCGRKSEINYKNVYDMSDEINCIINTTPVGMKENVYKRIIDINKFKNIKAVFDVIYNPINSLLIQDAKNKNIKNINGLKMLIEQARKSEEIFLDKKIDEENFNKLERIINYKNTNIALVGLSGCGKTEIGKMLSEKLGRKFVDTDFLLSNYYGFSSVSEMIDNIGISEFRKKETYLVKGLSTSRGIVISTGGGVYTKKVNINAINLNSIVFHVKRDFSLVDKKNRPLYKEISPEELFKKRKRFYEKADFEIQNNSKIEDAVDKIIDIIKEKYGI